MHDVDPARAAMFEDLEKNLIVPKARGLATALVVAKSARMTTVRPWEKVTEAPAHVDFVTDDLAAFLEAIIA